MTRRTSARFAATAMLVVLSGAADLACAFTVYKVDPTCGVPGAYSNIQDAVDAAAANPGTDYVWISHDGHTTTYSGQHIRINDPDGVIIEGGFNDCFDVDPAAELTTVSGDGNDGGPVFEITGDSNVYLGNLLIAYAQRDSDASGGGISFVGTGELDIATTSVILNNAGYGAGINVTATGGPNSAVLNLLHDVFISSNTAAVSGGGVRVESGARLIAAGTNTTIKGNHALAGYGGGVEILGPARADIGAPDFNSLIGVVNDNDAVNGGGVAVLDNGNGEAVLRAYAYDGAHPATFNQNRAYANGGAIYAAGLADACLFSPHLADNIAEDGAAIYYTFYVADGSGNFVTDGGIYVNAPPVRLPDECGPETVAALGGTTDCYSDQCNSIVGHVSRHADNTPSPGNVIYKDFNDLMATRLRIQDSTGGRVIASYGHNTSFKRCLITDNSVSDELIFSNGGLVEYKNCTIANNSIGSAYLINFDDTDTINLAYDIFDQPGKTTAYVITVYSAFNTSYLMAADTSGLPTSTNPGVIFGLPIFFDAAHGDYHLRATSPGVDFAPSSLDTVDLDGAPTAVDLPQVANHFGPSDLGAYELQTAFACDSHADAMFCDGFGP